MHTYVWCDFYSFTRRPRFSVDHFKSNLLKIRKKNRFRLDYVSIKSGVHSENCPRPVLKAGSSGSSK